MLPLLTLFTPVLSQTSLSGNIGGMTLDQSGNPFIVSDNITIPSAKSVTIHEGCVFLFKAFTGIIIYGSLSVEGSLDKPVVFTTINDKKYNLQSNQLPNPFDWNGILITARAEKVKLSNFVLEYSVYGIRSQKEELVISNGTFSQNGQFHFTINDVVKPVVDNMPFNFGELNLETNSSKNDPHAQWRKPFSISIGAVGIAALGVAGYFFYQKNDYVSRYTRATTQSEMNDLIGRQKSAIRNSIIGVVAGGILLPVGVTMYLLDEHSRKSRQLSVAPIIGKTNGVTEGINYSIRKL